MVLDCAPGRRPVAVTMSLAVTILILLFAAVGGALVLELTGRLRSPNLRVRGDLQRETQFLGQYGQFASLVVAVLVVMGIAGWDGGRVALALGVTAIVVLVVTHGLKRTAGRIRPGRERDGHRPGAFLGPTWRRLSWRESFPSSHAAGAFAMSAVLASAYPQAAWAWWTLAIGASVLRWMIDAHWLSDVVAGAAVGMVLGWACAWGVGI